MNKVAMMTSLVLNGCLLGNAAMAAQDTVTSRQLMANLDKQNMPALERSLTAHARKGDSNAQLALAKIYESENRHDPDLMVEWYKKSAVNGNAEAQFQLGLLYIDGEIPGGDWDTGYFWVEMAAEQGHERAAVVFESLQNEYFSIGC